MVEIGEIKTDPERMRSFTPELAVKMNTIGSGYPWRFTHFRKTNGYSNMPLDGIWLRAPYLHNGSVPTLRALMFPDERPAVFYPRLRRLRLGQRRLRRRRPDAEQGGVRFDTVVARQRQRRPSLWHDPAGRGSSGHHRVPEDAVTRSARNCAIAW